MRRFPLLALVAFLSNSLPCIADSKPEVLTEEDAEGMRQMMGITVRARDADSDVFNFRDEGTFLISKKAFTSRLEAVKFCQSKAGYHLTEGMIPGVILMMGLPFVSLRDHMSVEVPILGRGSNRTGYVTWATFDLSKIPASYNPRPEEIQIFEVIKRGEYYLSFTNGDGGSGGGFESTAQLNLSLKASGLPEIKIPAICVDERLAPTDRWLR